MNATPPLSPGTLWSHIPHIPTSPRMPTNRHHQSACDAMQCDEAMGQHLGHHSVITSEVTMCAACDDFTMALRQPLTRCFRAYD